MYSLQEKVCNTIGAVFQILYLILGYKINLDFEYENGFEFLIGMVVTTVIMNIIEFIICKLAYSITGNINKSVFDNSIENKMVHWVIRVILFLTVYVISLTPLCNIILTPIVKDCTQLVIDFMNEEIMNISDNAVKVLQDK